MDYKFFKDSLPKTTFSPEYYLGNRIGYPEYDKESNRLAYECVALVKNFLSNVTDKYPIGKKMSSLLGNGESVGALGSGRYAALNAAKQYNLDYSVWSDAGSLINNLHTGDIVSYMYGNYGHVMLIDRVVKDNKGEYQVYTREQAGIGNVSKEPIYNTKIRVGDEFYYIDTAGNQYYKISDYFIPYGSNEVREYTESGEYIGSYWNIPAGYVENGYLSLKETEVNRTNFFKDKASTERLFGVAHIPDEYEYNRRYAEKEAEKSTFIEGTIGKPSQFDPAMRVTSFTDSSIEQRRINIKIKHKKQQQYYWGGM